MFTIFITLATFAIAGTIPAHASEGARPVSVEQLAALDIPPSLLTGPAVILLEEDRMEISGRTAIREMRLVKKLLKSGLPDESAFRFTTGNNKKIRSIEGRAVYPDGREKIIASSDISIVPDFEDFVLYSDRKSHSFRFPGAAAGTIIEIKVTWKMEDLLFWDPVPFQRELPVLTRRYTLIHPRDFDFAVHASLMSDDPDTETELGDGKRMLVWERHDIEPFRHETLMPAPAETVPALWFSIRGDAKPGSSPSRDSWGGVADWYERLCSKSLEPGQGLRSLLDTLRLSGLSEREKASRVYCWVRTNLRYVAIYLGDEGYRPHGIEDVLANRYGDCKDQSAVLVAALKAAGIDAHLVLVRTTDLGSIPNIVPLPHYFNHVIVAARIDGDISYLDPTCDMCSFGILPEMDQGAAALMVGAGAERLTTLPCDSPHPNRSAVSVTAVISNDGDARATITMTLEGYFAVDGRHFFMKRAKQPKVETAAALLKDIMPSLRAEKANVDGENPDSDSLTITVIGIVPSLLDTEAPYPLMRVVGNPLTIDLPECGDRKYPLSLPSSHSLEYNLDLTLPDAWSIREAPPSGSVRGNGFAYAYHGSVEGRTVRFSRNWTVTSSRIPAADCAAVRNQLEAILDVEDARILAVRK